MNPFLHEMAASIAAAWQRDETAVRLIGVAKHRRNPGVVIEQGMPMPEWDRDRYDQTVDDLAARMGQERFNLLLEEGSHLPLDVVLRLVDGLRPPGANTSSHSGAHASSS